jgi:transposase
VVGLACLAVVERDTDPGLAQVVPGRLDEDPAAEPEHWPTVARLRCFRGIETLSALVLHLEVGDFGRFHRPGQLAAWLGLVPSLH